MNENVVEFNELEDVEEVVTPATAGTILCCVL